MKKNCNASKIGDNADFVLFPSGALARIEKVRYNRVRDRRRRNSGAVLPRLNKKWEVIP